MKNNNDSWGRYGEFYERRGKAAPARPRRPGSAWAKLAWWLGAVVAAWVVLLGAYWLLVVVLRALGVALAGVPK